MASFERNGSVGSLHTMQCIGWRWPVFVVCALSSMGHADGGDSHGEQLEVAQDNIVQEQCPVMIENKIDAGIHIEYQGERVYFCCNFCRAAFEKEPKKYLQNLPQFAHTFSFQDNHQKQTAAGSHNSQHEHSSGLRLIEFIKPLGIATLSLLILTVLMGIFRRKKPRLLFKWHKRLGITTLIIAILHATLVFIAH